MSYILEALKKSDQQRRTPDTLEHQPAPLASPSGKPVTARSWQIITLALSLLLLISWQLWPAISNQQTPMNQPPQENHSPEKPVKPATDPIVVSPTHHSQTTLAQQQATVRQQMQAYRPQRPVEGEELTSPSAAAPVVELPEQPDAGPSLQAAVAEQLTRPAPPIPSLQELSAEQQQQIPELNVSVSIYSTRAKNRRARINNTMYYEGDTLPSGLTLEEVHPDRLVLNHNGIRFRISP